MTNLRLETDYLKSARQGYAGPRQLQGDRLIHVIVEIDKLPPTVGGSRALQTSRPPKIPVLFYDWAASKSPAGVAPRDLQALR